MVGVFTETNANGGLIALAEELFQEVRTWFWRPRKRKARRKNIAARPPVGLTEGAPSQTECDRGGRICRHALELADASLSKPRTQVHCWCALLPAGFPRRSNVLVAQAVAERQIGSDFEGILRVQLAFTHRVMPRNHTALW